jgi:hypothetical protein
MRFRLRTLLIVLAIGPPIAATAYLTWQYVGGGYLFLDWSRPSPEFVREGTPPIFLPLNNPNR